MESSNNEKSRDGRRRGRCRTQKQRFLTKKSDVIDKAMRLVCLNGGEISFEELQKLVGSFDSELGSLKEIVSSDCHFELIHCEDGRVIVEACTEVQICSKYLKKECMEEDDCQDLHICGYFATGSCCWFGPNCQNSHLFRSEHNKKILRQFRIAFLSEQHLVNLFRWTWPKFTVPDFCGPYRGKSGCQKKHCRFLHVCKNFVMDDCKFGSRCRLAHDIFIEPSNLELMKRFQINVDHSSESIISLIKERHEGVYRPDSEILESSEEESEDEESDSRENNLITVKPETIPKSAKQLDPAKTKTPVKLSMPSADDFYRYYAPAESSTKFTLTKKSIDQPIRSEKQETVKRTVLPDSKENKHTTVKSATLQVSGKSTQEQKSAKQPDQAKTNTAAVKPAMPSTDYYPGQQALREIRKTAKSKPVQPHLPGLKFQNTDALDVRKEEICKDHLQGKCVSGSLCQKLHCDLPYQWQFLIDGEWCNVQKSTNNDMEKQFCEVIGGSVLTKLNEFFNVSFDGMFVSNIDGSLVHKIRRLEVKGETDISDVYLVSHWSWYWQDEGGKWIEYSKQNTKQNAQADKESCDFEHLYNAHKNNNGSPTVNFSAGSQKYTLDFRSMSQINDHYGTRKAVCRRPARHITLDDVKKYREEKPWLRTFPSTWDMKIRTPTSYKLVEVLKNENEYKEIAKLFEKTLPEANITQLERVQNETRWEAFARHKEFMMKSRYGRVIDEKLLFHGTRYDRIDDICRDNFDFRLSGTSTGHVYGHGAYFATSAKYSNDYADPDHNNIKKMFVARVLVGSYTVGTKDMRRPPFKNPSDKSKGMYDSCVNDLNSPTIFVVFDNNQVYPEYVITYEDPKSYSKYSATSYSSTTYGYARSNTSRSSFSKPVKTSSYSSSSNLSRSHSTPSYRTSNPYSSASSNPSSSSNASSSSSGSKNGCICM